MSNHFFGTTIYYLRKHSNFLSISVDSKLDLIFISISVDQSKYKNHVYIKKTEKFFHKFIDFVEIPSQATHKTNK